MGKDMGTPTTWPGQPLSTVIAVALALLSPAAHPASICRWVDDSGRTQISDAVPDKFRNSATCSDSRQYELSPQQKREAEQREAEAQTRAHPIVPDPPKKAASSVPGAGGPVALPGARNAKRPADVITDSTDCPTRWRIYDESVACFGPYRTTRGTTKPEGFDMCNDIPSPETMCGPRRN